MKKSEYPPNWKDVIRPTILRRDGYKCQSCGIKHRSLVYVGSKGQYIHVDEFGAEWANYQGKRVITIYLTVAHLDQDKTNNDASNLLSLCPRCHSRYDRKYNSLSRNILKKAAKPNLQKVAKFSGALNDHEFSTIRKVIWEATNVNIDKATATEVFLIIQKLINNESN